MWIPVCILEFVVCFRRLHDNEEATRMREVMTSIEETGTYELTEQELAFGAKLAWRNASRCIGRKQWLNLKVQCSFYGNIPFYKIPEGLRVEHGKDSSN